MITIGFNAKDCQCQLWSIKFRRLKNYVRLESLKFRLQKMVKIVTIYRYTLYFQTFSFAVTARTSEAFFVPFEQYFTQKYIFLISRRGHFYNFVLLISRKIGRKIINFHTVENENWGLFGVRIYNVVLFYLQLFWCFIIVDPSSIKKGGVFVLKHVIP